jgi:hypothetical protein
MSRRGSLAAARRGKCHAYIFSGTDAAPMHVGPVGTMVQLYLSDLKEKTRRG